MPWAREPSISYLATPNDMQTLLTGACFKILQTQDSTQESQRWFEAVARTGRPVASCSRPTAASEAGASAGVELTQGVGKKGHIPQFE